MNNTSMKIRLIKHGTEREPCTCSACESRDGRDVLQIGDEPDYGVQTAWLCKECWAKAGEMFT